MIAQIPILAVSLPSEIFDLCRFSRTKCIYMHFKYLNLTRIKSSKVLNVLLDHLSSTMRMCASGVHGLVSVCKATINIKAHWYSCFGMILPPDLVPTHTFKVSTVISGLHSAVLSSTSDPPDSNLSTLNKYNLRNRPFLTRLVGDPFGKEAAWETNIGDTKHVIKHIN
jgi:hypothetical protein